MGLNEQADAVTLDTGHDGSENFSTGQDDDSTSGGDDDEDSSASIDDIVDAESYLAAAEQMAEADMPDQEGGESDEGDAGNGEGDDVNDQQSDNADSQAQADDKQGDDAGEGGDDGDDNKGDDAGDDGDQNKSTSKRFRVRSEDPVDLRALELKSRNPDMSLSDAMARAQAEVGDNDSSDSKDDTTGDQGSDDLPSTVKDAEAKIEELRAQRKTAMREDLDFERADELDDEIYRLTAHIGDLKLSNVQTESADQQTYLQDLEESKGKAVELYPFVTNSDGAEIERMEEIDRQLEENGDPLFTSADKPLKIAQMVASEFGIAPKGKVIKQPTVQTGGKPPRQKSPVQPASASARTAPKDQKGQAAERLANVNSIEDWDELMDEVQ